MNEQDAYVDPIKLQEFAIHLKGFAADTDKATDRLLIALSGLGKTWQDPAFEQFQQRTRGLAQALLPFVEGVDRFSGYLITKADEAKQIHQMNLPG